MELITLALKYAPWVANMVFGGGAEQAITQITNVAKRVFGTTDVVSIEQQIAQDNNKAEMFKAELDAKRGELEASLKDVQSARQQTVELIRSGSVVGWGAPLVSGIVAIGFFMVIAFYFYGRVPPGDAANIVNILVGTMAAAFMQVITYWLGSSAGSQKKDLALANSVPAAIVASQQAQVKEDTREDSSRERASRPVLRRD